MSRDLSRLARLVYDLTRREVWLGGKIDDYKPGGEWPNGLNGPRAPLTQGGHGHASSGYWTLSPEVDLGGHKIRVCITSKGEWGHTVTVTVDGEVKHPGGVYVCWDFWWHRWPWPRWSTRVADQERADGGKTGPVDRRDLLIEEARSRLAPPKRLERQQGGELSEVPEKPR